MDFGGCELQQVGKTSKGQSPASKQEVISHMHSRKKNSPVISGINQFWVLHRGLIKRGVIALLLLLAVIFTFQMRDVITKSSSNIGMFISEKLVSLGFGVEEISITGQFLTNESDVIKSLELDDNISIITFDVSKARDRIKQLPSVSSVTIRKSYPSTLVISLVEKKPIARWRVGGQTYVIDLFGNRIATSVDGADENLLLVIGKGANDDANNIVNALSAHPKLNDGVVAVSRIADRRWDLIYKNGLRVQLPEFGVALALEKLLDYQVKYSLFDRDISLIDLRVQDELVVRLIEHGEQDEEDENDVRLN